MPWGGASAKLTSSDTSGFSAAPLMSYKIENVLLTVPGRPLNGAIVARLSAAEMQAPVGVPANGASVMVALETLPFGSNVTATVTLPVGPPLSLQACASLAACANGTLVAAASKRAVGAIVAPLDSALRAPAANSSAKPAPGVAPRSGAVTTGSL